MAQSSPLLRAALDLTHNPTNYLLPLLMTDSQALIDAAVLTLETVINSHYSHIVVLPTELHLAADAIVRLMLSHITRPASSPSIASAEIGWIASHTLGRR